MSSDPHDDRGHPALWLAGASLAALLALALVVVAEWARGFLVLLWPTVAVAVIGSDALCWQITIRWLGRHLPSTATRAWRGWVVEPHPQRVAPSVLGCGLSDLEAALSRSFAHHS